MKRNFELENDIYCRGEFDSFKLYYKGTEITDICSNIAYIPRTLIAVKCGNTVHIYKPKIVYVDSIPHLEKIAMFETNGHYVYLRIKIKERTYDVDSNVQINLLRRLC